MTDVQVAELKIKMSEEIRLGISDILNGIYDKKNDQTVDGITKLYGVLDLMGKEIKNYENSNLNAQNK